MNRQNISNCKSLCLNVPLFILVSPEMWGLLLVAGLCVCRNQVVQNFNFMASVLWLCRKRGCACSQGQSESRNGIQTWRGLYLLRNPETWLNVAVPRKLTLQKMGLVQLHPGLPPSSPRHTHTPSAHINPPACSPAPPAPSAAHYLVQVCSVSRLQKSGTGSNFAHTNTHCCHAQKRRWNQAAQKLLGSWTFMVRLRRNQPAEVICRSAALSSCGWMKWSLQTRLVGTPHWCHDIHDSELISIPTIQTYWSVRGMLLIEPNQPKPS